MPYQIDQIKEISKEVRIDCIKMLTKAGSGHPGSSLSCADLITTLFLTKINRTKENVFSPDRHRFLLSKGHAVPALYAVYAHIGLLTKEDLLTFRELDSPLQGHPDFGKFKEIELSSGSLGQGISIAQGMAIASKLDKLNFNVYCLVGDGEIEEGQNWEALMSAPKFKLDNLCVIMDYNNAQIDGKVCDIMNIEPIIDKLKAFNWHVIVIDGHNYEQIIKAYDEFEQNKDKPTFIVANTIKGKGVSFMEDKIEWHGVAPNKEQAEHAIKDLMGSYA